MTAQDRRKRRGVAPALDLSAGLEFPFRKEARVPAESGPRAESAAQEVLASAGFRVIQRWGPGRTSADLRPADTRVWVGERGLRRRRDTASSAIAPIIAVFVGGSILGGLDAYIVGSVLVGIFWVLGAAVVGGIFWLRYGGTYDSDIVMLTLSEAKSRSDAAPKMVSAGFWAARVRSQVRSGVRTPLVVDGPLRLVGELGTMMREFERRMTMPVAQVSPATPSR